MPNTTSRIRHITGVTRYHVDMHMHHRLSRRCTRIEAHVVAIRLGTQRRIQFQLYVIDQRHQCRLLIRRGVEPRGHQAFSQHQRMPSAHRKPIEDRKRKLVGQQPFFQVVALKMENAASDRRGWLFRRMNKLAAYSSPPLPPSRPTSSSD